ncbi:MAG TPA: hypothetical protein VJI69_01670 [Bacteroidia bacterium]|nr:hypothetical protein [Bacteroidia bacterium]
MKVIKNFRLKRAIAALIVSIGMMTPLTNCAVLRKDTKTSDIKKNSNVSNMWSTETLEQFKKLKVASNSNNIENTLKELRGLTELELIEVQLDMRAKIYTAANSKLGIAKGHIQILRNAGQDTTNLAALAQELENKVNDAVGEGMAIIQARIREALKKMGPECNNEPYWVKNWRNRNYIWKDGDDVYIVGLGANRFELAAREEAEYDANHNYLTSIVKEENGYNTIRGVSYTHDTHVHHVNGYYYWVLIVIRKK